MRYLPLSDADRSEMLRVIGAGSVDDLFRDVPEAARLQGPIAGLSMHASEMAVTLSTWLVGAIFLGGPLIGGVIALICANLWRGEAGESVTPLPL